MSPRTERQHFVPAFYLARWATPQERTGRLKVFDRSNGNSWPSAVEGVAFARDFYTIESREAPQAVEDMLAKLEGIGAAAIQEVITTETLPKTSEGLHRLMSFVALQAARIPRVRSNLSSFYSEVHRRVCAVRVLANTRRSVKPAAEPFRRAEICASTESLLMIKQYKGKSGTQWQVYGRRDKKKVYVGTYDSEREAKNAERRFVVTQEQIDAGELPAELDLERTLKQATGEGSRRSRRTARAHTATTPSASGSTSFPSSARCRSHRCARRT